MSNYGLKKIANFEIASHLGRGGMGDVYSAIQQPLGRRVALKVLFANSPDDDEARRRFETEAKAISRLEHTNIVSLYDYGVDRGLHYFSMQFIDGQDLLQLINKKGLPLPSVMEYARQIARGLLYAHRQGVIHRDVKPQNILIDNNGNCAISDFGIAQIFREKSITMTGIAVGTPEYMSPEQASGKEVDLRTDIYSLGIVIYEMLTGTVPFHGQNAVSVAYKQVHEQPAPPSVHRRDIPRRLELIVVKMLKKDKTLRYNSMEEFLDDLDTVDLDDKVSKIKDISAEEAAENRRITDRRSGDRRGEGNRRAEFFAFLPFKPFSLTFWMVTLRQQWLSMLLITILFILHFIK